MSHDSLTVETTVHAPMDMVFERLIDHESMNDWPGVGSCRLIVAGTPRNGLGAVRAVKARGLTLHEEVVLYEPPERFEYRIIKGLPVTHLGSVRLFQEGESVRVCWRITVSSRLPLLSWIICQQLRGGLPKALAYFKAETEKAARAARAAG